MNEFQNTLQTFCSEYSAKRKQNFSDKEFLALIISYPSLLVACADGDFDEKEQELLVSLAIGLHEEFENTEFTQNQIEKYETIFLNEFLFLAENESDWKTLFLDFLFLFATPEMSEIQQTIKRMLIDVAEVSAGISEEEQEVIEFISTNYLS